MSATTLTTQRGSHFAAIIRHPIITRVGSAVTTLAGAAILVFIMLRAIPGDQITATLGTEAAALTPAQRQALEQYYGINQPLTQQFFTWLGQVFHGNFGYSARSQISVGTMLANSLPVTIELAILSIVIAVVLGVPIGMFAASRPNKTRDMTSQAFALAGLSIPSFLLATALLTWGSQAFHFNPNGRPYTPPWVDFGNNLEQMLLPAFTLGFGISAPIIRTTRTAVMEVRGLDFIRTALAKGISVHQLQRRHVLRNALVPIVTMTGLQLGYLLGGAVVVEQVFSLPGIGRQVLVGIQQKEYAVVQSTVLVIAFFFVLVNLLTDLMYRWVDPRVRAA